MDLNNQWPMAATAARDKLWPRQQPVAGDASWQEAAVSHQSMVKEGTSSGKSCSQWMAVVVVWLMVVVQSKSLVIVSPRK